MTGTNWCKHGKTDQVYCADCHVVSLQQQVNTLTDQLELKQSELQATYAKVYRANDVARDVMKQVDTLMRVVQETGDLALIVRI